MLHEQPSPKRSPPTHPGRAAQESTHAPAAVGAASDRTPQLASSAKVARGERLDPFELDYALRDFEHRPIAPLLRAANAGVYEQCQRTCRLTRAFAEQELLGRVEDWDERIGNDHDLIPWPVLQAAVPYRFYSLNIPGVLGGMGLGSMPTALFAEEIAAADAGVFVLFGAHALALSLIIASGDMRMLNRLAGELIAAESRGEPMVLALAHTEPGGGSDVEDVDDIGRAKVGSRFTRVPGGYRLNARKVFISNGSVAHYSVVTAFEDLHRPLQTMRSFLVPKGAPGLSIGRIEHKLGQRLSTAAEVVCEDVFVPERDAVRMNDGGRTIDGTLVLTRGPVGAMATGIVRGTLERTLRYLQHKRVRGQWLFEQQHVQLRLGEMLAALQAGRGLYTDAALAVDYFGIGAALRGMPSKIPGWVARSQGYRALVDKALSLGRSQALVDRLTGPDVLQRLVAHSSIAKFACSDLSVRTAMQAMEILGPDANDPQWGVEKCMRDAKLGQIFEGTNQINRLHVARGLLTRRGG